MAESSDLYDSSYREKSLQDNELASRATQVKRIDRTEKKKGLANPKRDISSLFTLMKIALLLLVILVAFFLVRAGINIYNERLKTDQIELMQTSPVLKPIELIGVIDIEQEPDKISFFEKEIARWEASRRHVRAAEQLLFRDNLVQATERAQQALIENPASSSRSG